MPKILIAVVTCHRFRHRADAQRETWCPMGSGADVRFFLGRGGVRERADEVSLNVPDDYESLAQKCRAAFQWALDHGYDHVLKCDDDAYVQFDRLLRSDFQHDYVGKLSVATTGIPKEPYAAGFCYWLSRRSMEVLLKSEVTDWVEDRWAGATLRAAGIPLHRDDRYVLINALNPQNLPLSGTEGPLAENDVIAAAEFLPAQMHEVHNQWMASCESSIGQSARAASPLELSLRLK